MQSSEAPSKSQRKRDAAAKRALAGRLLEIGPARLDRLSLDREILDEIAAVERARGHRARQRQLGRLAKILRRHDTTDLETRLEALDTGDAAALRARHHAEQWRERLLAEPRDIDLFVAEHPHAQPSRLRALLRDAARPSDGAGPNRVKAFRELYRELLAAIARD